MVRGFSEHLMYRLLRNCLALQDFLTSSYLLTSKDRFYTRAQMGQLICQMGDALGRVELPQPALLKPMELWTGKQVFSMLVRPSSQARYDTSLQKAEVLTTSSAAGFSHQRHGKCQCCIAGCDAHALSPANSPAEAASLLLTGPCRLSWPYVALH